MKKKMLALILAAMMTAGMFSGCNSGGNNGGSTPSSGQPAATDGAKKEEGGSSTSKGKDNEIVFTICGATLEDGINPTTKAPAEGWNTYAKTVFKDNNPDIDIKINSIPWDNARGKLQTLLMSDGTDLFSVGGGYVPGYYQENLIQSLNPFMENDSEFVYEDNFPANFKTSLNCTDFDGKELLTLPWAIGYRIIMYDKEIFEQWGVEPLSEHPTPEEILEKASKMTGKNPVTGKENYGLFFAGNSMNLSYLIPLNEHFGGIEGTGNFGDMKGFQWSFNTPEYIQSLQWLTDAVMYTPAASVNGQGAEMFGTRDNDIAIYLDGNGVALMNEVRNKNDEALIDKYDCTLHFSPSGGNWTPIDGVAMSAKLTGDKAQNAWETLKFVTGPETATWNYNQFGPSVVAHKVGAELYDPKDKFIRRNDEVAALATHPGYEINPFFASNIQPTITSIISRARNGEKVDLQKEMDTLQNQAVEWSATK